MRNKIILNIILALFIVLFLYTAGSKLLNYQGFVLDIKQSPIFKSISSGLLWTIPCAELTIAMLLFSRSLRLAGLYAALLLMLTFTGYIILLNYFMDYIPCSCGGILETLSPGTHILLNILLTVMALGGIYLQKKTIKP